MNAEQSVELRKPFPPEQIGQKPQPYKKDSPKGQCRECGGYHGLPAMHLDFVGHAIVTDRLLKVDPEWTWEPMATDEHGLPVLDRAGNLWIRLTVGGVTRIGVGDGPDAKQLISDAIRNAAMRFGVALDLWSRQELSASASDASEPMPASQDVSDGPYGYGDAPEKSPSQQAHDWLVEATPNLGEGERRALVVKALAPRDVGTATATDADWLWLLETWKRDGINLDKAAA